MGLRRRDPPLDVHVMPSFQVGQTVIYAQLNPLGDYIICRIGGGGKDR